VSHLASTTFVLIVLGSLPIFLDDNDAVIIQPCNSCVLCGC